jgi:hypothetical protein
VPALLALDGLSSSSSVCRLLTDCDGFRMDTALIRGPRAYPLSEFVSPAGAFTPPPFFPRPGLKCLRFQADAKAFCFKRSNSACVIEPLSSRALALPICSAGSVFGATDWT